MKLRISLGFALALTLAVISTMVADQANSNREPGKFQFVLL
jgi:hypothetical protein